MVSRADKSPRGIAAAAQLAAQAQALVLLWGRAEDSAVPRIPPSQLRVLTVLDWHGPMNLNRLSLELGAIPSSASRLCDRLEAAGLLHRQVSADSRREVTLSLSPQGRRRLDAFAVTRSEDFVAVLDRMTPHARTALLEGLQQFSAAAEAVTSAARPA